VLDRSGYQVSTASNGPEALERTRKAYFDLIIVDLYMPGMEGTATIRQLRENNPYTPIILSTGSAGDGELRDGLEAGATRVLMKPVNPEGLIREVNNLIALYGTIGQE
jgi:CheY-like chemotaxis protein